VTLLHTLQQCHSDPWNPKCRMDGRRQSVGKPAPAKPRAPACRGGSIRWTSICARVSIHVQNADQSGLCTTRNRRRRVRGGARTCTDLKQG